MKIAVIGATGRTGTPLVAELLRRGHEITVLARNPDKLADQRDAVTVIPGSSTDREPVRQLVDGADAVVSTLGPSGRESDLQTRTANLLVDLLPAQARFVGVSGAGIDVPGDRKGTRDKVISFMVRSVGGAMAKDKVSEYAVFAASNLDWTLVRPPRLVDGPATGSVTHDAHVPGSSTSIRRTDLAIFLADVVEQRLYVRQAPFVCAA
ncbi:MAG: NAD(P)H-binding protein [Candidatus Nanopelagicales bacterium]|jgi:putative NADH-flavin reductase|nr:NAD(P)H-binding protein [Candidatus Nanopelagicales bacterium]